MHNTDVLVLEHVNKSFGKRAVVRDVSFTVREGQVFGFLGPNGAGKTTTIKMILGLLAPDSGTIVVNGHSIDREFEAAMKCISGIVENPDMYGYLSGYDNLKIQARACGVDEKVIGEVVELVGMQMRIREKFKSYSLGMKQRLGVAQALLRHPKVIILDEPTNGLDPAGIREFRDMLRSLAHEHGLAVLVSSHILQEMQLMCDTVGIINNGELLQVGTMEELMKRSGASHMRYILRPTERALALLREQAAERLGDVTDAHVDLQLSEEEIPAFNRWLMDNQIDILGLVPVGNTLEQTFMQITGGGNVVE